jgi:CO/xanthine dehydrogenase FAD-binding subunit
MITGFRYAAPKDRAELLGLLSEDGAKALAGGTDLLVSIRSGASRPSLLVDLKKVRGYAEISWSAEEGLLVGPAATVADLLDSAEAAAHFPLLGRCARELGSPQVRNRATVAGNLANASPCADMAPPLLCLGARLRVASRRGERELPLSELFAGPKKTVLAPDEIIELVVVPPRGAGSRGGYMKLKRIKGHDLGLVAVALSEKGGEIRLGIASAGPTPVLVEGLAASGGEEAVAKAAVEVISPIDDIRCGAEYRAYMVETFARRLYAEVVA